MDSKNKRLEFKAYMFPSSFAPPMAMLSILTLIVTTCDIVAATVGTHRK
jgi:hypothetical protein